MIFCSKLLLARGRETEGEEAIHCLPCNLYRLTQSLADCRLIDVEQLARNIALTETNSGLV